ncbi:MAG: hypothetical protein AB8H79_26230 [Myxococcota bacterium]
MRIFVLTLGLSTLWAACSTTPAPSAPTDAPKVDEPAKAAAKTPKAEKDTYIKEPYTPKASPVPVTPVAVAGYGLKIEINPPFQGAYMGTYVHEENTEGLILSWWDVTEMSAGAHGHAGLNNIGVAVHPTDADAPIIKTKLPWPNGRLGVAYRRGETGSYVLLPEQMMELGGIGAVSAGPLDPSWAIEVDGKRTPFGPKQMLHSADPAKGPPFKLMEGFERPWGPWPGRVKPPEAPTPPTP